MMSTLKTLVAVFAILLLGAAAAGQQTPTAAELLRQFQRTTEFSGQFEVAKEIARTADARVMKELEPSLHHEDRHLRANAAFVFASLGDRRGLETISGIIADRSYRPLGQGIAGGSFNMDAPGWWLAAQIHADRYYAVHLLGELRDRRALNMLVPLLSDQEINYHVAWALGQIGDRRAIGPLISALADRDAFVRVSAIQALETLNATEALAPLRALLNDQAMPMGPGTSVADVAKAAIAKLQKEP